MFPRHLFPPAAKRKVLRPRHESRSGVTSANAEVMGPRHEDSAYFQRFWRVTIIKWDVLEQPQMRTSMARDQRLDQAMCIVVHGTPQSMSHAGAPHQNWSSHLMSGCEYVSFIPLQCLSQQVALTAPGILFCLDGTSNASGSSLPPRIILGGTRTASYMTYRGHASRIHPLPDEAMRTLFVALRLGSRLS
nr:hypothetical protein Iba_chr12fCG8650 [Ipomoea batatas]